MTDEVFLRQRVRSAIQTGALPNRPPLRPGGRPATGVTCVVCKERTTDGEHELTYQYGLRLKTYHLHPACFRIFQQELERLSQPEAHGDAVSDP